MCKYYLCAYIKRKKLNVYNIIILSQIFNYNILYSLIILLCILCIYNYIYKYITNYIK